MAPMLSKLIGRKNNRKLKKCQRLVDKINDLEKIIKSFTDSRLQAKTQEFRQRILRGESLENILPEAFATAREAANRVLGMRHFDCQILGGLVLHQGKIAQIKTGEGKTIVATLPAYLNGLVGKGVHVITVNEHLAKQDKERMGPLYEYLGLSVALISRDMDSQLKEEAYSSDITYGSYDQFGLDYLSAKLYGINRTLSYAILDEVDIILIDNAVQELVITTTDKASLARATPLYYFQKYTRLAGMTGCADDNIELFDKIYGLEVVSIPKRRPTNRTDYQDLIYKSKNAKFMAIAEEVDYWYRKGRPILVDTPSIQEAEILGNFLKKKAIHHMIVNPAEYEEESKIIALAGQRGAITIVTNMHTRREIIRLGKGASKLGGLHIIGTERNLYRRFDNQLCDLAGADGNPGSTRFFLSLEDDLLKMFGSNRMSTIMDKLGMEEDEAIEHSLITKAIKNAQRKVGKHVLESFLDLKNKDHEF